MKASLVLQIWFGSLLYALRCQAKHCHDSQQLKESYDYVIIGGGTSGLVVANRLTENPDVDVLVIEVGELDDESPGTFVPGLRTPQKYWRTSNSVPQTGLNNRTSQVYTGEVVGGGTVINGMFFNRGSAIDYDAWEELGNPGWSWNDLLPYFKKSETYSPATPEIQAQYPASPDLSPHGTHGPVGSSYPPFSWNVIKHWYRAWAGLHVMLNPQSNAGLATGVLHSSNSLTYLNQSRSHASAAYYKGQPSQRPNWDLLTGHRVGRVLFKGNKAVGAEYKAVNAKQLMTVRASREVILAAGAVWSPQILQLSGVGSRKLLSGLGIRMVEDLPGVGYNFHDQPNYYIVLNYTKFNGPNPDWLDSDIDQHKVFAKEQLDLYYKKRQGAYTFTFEAGSDVAYLPLPNITDDYRAIIDQASKTSISAISQAGTDPSIIHGHEAQRDIILKHFSSTRTAIQESTFNGAPTIIIVNLKPLSRGSILINSTNPAAVPVIDFATFAHPTDLQVLIASLRKNREVIKSGPMQELGAVELAPGTDIESDAAIGEALKNGTLSSWQHPVGTLPMMPRELGGVVDSELRVYGVERLRVVDASMMPIIPSSHTSSTVYAVAEKAADLIKASQ